MRARFYDRFCSLTTGAGPWLPARSQRVPACDAGRACSERRRGSAVAAPWQRRGSAVAAPWQRRGSAVAAPPGRAAVGSGLRGAPEGRRGYAAQRPEPYE
eukprot:scaffold19384_cov37-Phaeocystis_antarctica.AAC.2